ncbi:Aste57867_9876 [Aphanomyces stellatus]|uniref:Aste57867_9876 protein n=1 Tax=Aphanomyces stellatus TaxID=120398 RepID=A0A485KNY6_9STRA|nr:hypothetical protein As57867_009837 [Aphanomyces stellatus]VFT86755.1 Aste57867_9876 [Aphanomyces stellatus]
MSTAVPPPCLDDATMFDDVVASLAFTSILPLKTKRRATPFRKIQRLRSEIVTLTDTLETLRSARRQRGAAMTLRATLRHAVSQANAKVEALVDSLRRQECRRALVAAHQQIERHASIHRHMERERMRMESVFAGQRRGVAQTPAADGGIDFTSVHTTLATVSAATYATTYWQIFAAHLPLRLDTLTIELVDRIDQDTLCVQLVIHGRAMRYIIQRFQPAKARTVFIMASMPPGDLMTWVSDEVSWRVVDAIADTMASVATCDLMHAPPSLPALDLGHLTCLEVSKALVARHVDRVMMEAAQPPPSPPLSPSSFSEMVFPF